MNFESAASTLSGIPYTSASKGRLFYDLVMTRRPKSILELGFAHGVSTCYFAAAATQIGGCTITAVDLDQSRHVDPTIETLVQKMGFGAVVTVRREQSSYTWFLKKEIQSQTNGNVCTPKYDLIFIDGPKDWTNDGCAFFLADKLLNDGGAIIFDDYNWSYQSDEEARGVRHEHGYVFPLMSPDEYREPQIKAVFQLLVLQHPNYGEFEIMDDQLAMARKTIGTPQKRLTISTRYSMKYRALSFIRRAVRRGTR